MERRSAYRQASYRPLDVSEIPPQLFELAMNMRHEFAANELMGAALGHLLRTTDALDPRTWQLSKELLEKGRKGLGLPQEDSYKIFQDAVKEYVAGLDNKTLRALGRRCEWGPKGDGVQDVRFAVVAFLAHEINLRASEELRHQSRSDYSRHCV